MKMNQIRTECQDFHVNRRHRSNAYSHAVSAFMGLVENEDNNGAVMTVTNAHGIMPMKFPLDP